jgi:hypothetical protein
MKRSLTRAKGRPVSLVTLLIFTPSWISITNVSELFITVVVGLGNPNILIDFSLTITARRAS